jgi:hypothetical protein
MLVAELKNVFVVTVLLFFFGCVSTPTPDEISGWDVNKAIVLALSDIDLEGPYCLEVSGEPPSRTLRRQLKPIGHRLISCESYYRTFVYVSIRGATLNQISLTLSQSKGMYVRDHNFIIERNAEGSMHIVQHEVVQVDT